MNKLSIIFAALAATCFALCQDGSPSAPLVSRNYHQYRIDITEPTYGLAKVKAMIKNIKAADDDGTPLTAAQFESLSVPEKFTFTMIHGEEMDQNCDPMPAIVGEEKLIFGELPGNFDYTAAWSERQIAFLKHNRKAVISMIRKEMHKHSHVGLNLKHAIVEIDAYELIPDLVAAFDRNKKDLDVLTTLFLLMKDGKYKPFLESATYEKCYGPKADYKSCVDGNTANQKLTIQRAEAYYKGRMG